MLARLRHHLRLNYAIALAVVTGLLAAGLPNLVIHAHAADGDVQAPILESAHHEQHAVEGSTVPPDSLHMHDFGALGHVPVLPSAMPGISVGLAAFASAEPGGRAAEPFSSHPLRPPAA